MEGLLQWSISLLVLGACAGWVMRRQRRTSFKKMTSTGRVDSGVRLVDGRAPNLRREWTHGEWSAEAGRLSHYGIVLTVEAIAPGIRKATLREGWRVRPGADIVTLRCQGCVVEWALPEGFREYATGLLAVPVALSYPGLTSRLTDLGGRVDTHLSEQRRSFYYELLDHDEPELALEMLAGYLSEDLRPIAADVRSEALALAGAMQIDERISRALALCPDESEEAPLT